MIYRYYRFRLAPTTAQDATLRQCAGVCRLVYNLALEQRRDFWRQYRHAKGRSISFASQCREITALRAEFDWIEAVPRGSLEQAVRDLDAAFSGFFAGRVGYPTPRVKGVHDSFRVRAVDSSVRRLNAKWSAVRLAKLGWVKFRSTRPTRGRFLNVTVSLHAGEWYASLTHEVERDEPANTLPAVGVDRGIAQTITLSTGEHMQMPPQTSLTAHRKRAQRALARCRRGSARRKVVKARVAALSARAARVRTDWCHKASTDIARRFGVVAIENLKIRNMTASAAGTIAEPGRSVRQKAGLNRAILEQSWGRFASFLRYKLNERGGTLISVPAAYTSQTCASCGVVDARSRESQAVFRCVHCDHTDNADVNAAKEILRRGSARQGAEGRATAPMNRQSKETQHV